jgi:hypothetical protein
MKLLIALALILGVIFVMGFAVLDIGRDVARRRYPLSRDVEDDDWDGSEKDVPSGLAEVDGSRGSLNSDRHLRN